MENPRNIHISDYAYDLPDERIAKYPKSERDSSKLLVCCGPYIGEHVFRDLPAQLPEGSLMIFNNTRVIRARLFFHKSTGALIEVFCLEPYSPADYQQNFAQTGEVAWTCLVGNLKKWKEGPLERQLTLRDGRTLRLTAERQGTSGTGHVVRFAWDVPDVSFGEVLEACGQLPIPPYLNRATEESDLQNYQTVYSKIKGSVAAPTAGLHFTDRVLAELDARGIERGELTLHVGAGTFKPVKAAEIGDHEMHAEWIEVPLHIVERLIAHGGRCVAVGTTSVRSLESLYYVGVLLHEHPDAHPDDLHIPQWLPYEYAERQPQPLSTLEALAAVRDYLVRSGLDRLHTSTQIIIAPGYDFHIVDVMVTNFHQPQSTLLLLVSAFLGGQRWREVYRFALAHDFRFLSYGDSSVLFRQGATS
ncbi:MAG: S-adenosylmethionine:tRNA ribosyltransferase-isomerase [Alloprevotella sp.]